MHSEQYKLYVNTPGESGTQNPSRFPYVHARFSYLSSAERSSCTYTYIPPYPNTLAYRSSTLPFILHTHIPRESP